MPTSDSPLDKKLPLGKLIMFVVAVIFLTVAAFNIWDTVPRGQYHILQAAFTGNMRVIMDPGTYVQKGGDIQPWTKATTYEFGTGTDNPPVHVRFNDGSECDVDGSVRITMPKSPEQALLLVTDLGYQSQADLNEKLVLKAITNSLRLTANLMSARESYTDKRYEFNAQAIDQMNNGIYKTESYIGITDDLLTGEKVQTTLKRVKVDSTGVIQYEPSDLTAVGITLSNLEVKALDYDPKVKAQIQKQQESLMAVETARADALKAEQDRITAEARGKADVETAKYAELTKAQVIIAQAERDLQKARLDAQAAEEYKKEQILRGQGEAERKRLVMAADGALQAKLDAYVKVQQAKWASIGAYPGNWVPSITMGGEAGAGSGLPPWLDIMGVNAARELGLDLGMKTGKK